MVYKMEKKGGEQKQRGGRQKRGGTARWSRTSTGEELKTDLAAERFINKYGTTPTTASLWLAPPRFRRFSS